MSNAIARTDAFKFLGISNEQALAEIKKVVSDQTSSPEALAQSLPTPLLVLAAHLEGPDYESTLKEALPFPISSEVLSLAHDISKEIGPISSHPAYSEAKKIAKASLAKERKLASQELASDDSQSPFEQITTVACAPMLVGKRPPYIPAMKIELVNSSHEVVFSELMHWYDTLFVVRALLLALADHATNSKLLVAEGQLAKAEIDLEQLFEEVTNSAQCLREILVNTGKAQTENDPGSKS